MALIYLQLIKIIIILILKQLLALLYGKIIHNKLIYKYHSGGIHLRLIHNMLYSHQVSKEIIIDFHHKRIKMLYIVLLGILIKYYSNLFMLILCIILDIKLEEFLILVMLLDNGLIYFRKHL